MGRPEKVPPANVPVGSGNTVQEFHNLLVLYRRDATEADVVAMVGVTGNAVSSAQVSFSVGRSSGSEGRLVQDTGVGTSVSKLSMFTSDSASSALKKFSALLHSIFIEFLSKKVISTAAKGVGKSSKYVWKKSLGPTLAFLWKGIVSGAHLSMRAVNGCIYYLSEASKKSGIASKKASEASVYASNWLSETKLSISLSNAANVMSNNFMSQEGTLFHSIFWKPAASVSRIIGTSIRFIAVDVVSTGCMMLSNATSIASAAIYNTVAASSRWAGPKIAKSLSKSGAALGAISHFIFVTSISKGLWETVLRDFFIYKVSHDWISKYLSHDIFWEKLRSKQSWKASVSLSGTIWGGSKSLSAKIGWSIEQSGKKSTQSWNNLRAASTRSHQSLTQKWQEFYASCLGPALDASKTFSNKISEKATACYQHSIKPYSIDPAIKSGRYASASAVWSARSVGSGLKGSGIITSNIAKKLSVEVVSNLGIVSLRALSTSASLLTSGKARPDHPEWVKSEWNQPNFKWPAFEKPE